MPIEIQNVAVATPDDIANLQSQITAITGHGALFNVFCVLRNSGSGWAMITSGGHTPLNIASVTTVNGSSTAGYVQLTFTHTASAIGSIVAVADDTFAPRGIQCGSSVGTSVCNICFGKNGTPIAPNDASLISSDGDIWVLGTMWS